jgi:hypothetical protein
MTLPCHNPAVGARAASALDLSRARDLPGEAL